MTLHLLIIADDKTEHSDCKKSIAVVFQVEVMLRHSKPNRQFRHITDKAEF